MRIAVAVSGVGEEDLTFVEEAERLGADSVWVAEAWGDDAFTPLAFLPARTSRIRLATRIAQIGARTPALLAMSAMSMQALSGGRFLLGLGTSGPQVMEGWHGVRFNAPLAMTRETIEILRTVTAGERLTHDGAVYQLPLPGGAGRAIRSMAPPVRVPVYLAALGPKNLALTGELADGWLANAFMPETAAALLPPLAAPAPRARPGPRSRWPAAPAGPAGPSPTSMSWSRWGWSSPTTRRRPPVGTRAATPSRSARWATVARTSTTPLSSDRVTATTSVSCISCGGPATGNGPPTGCRWISAGAPTCSAPERWWPSGSRSTGAPASPPSRRS